MDVRRLLKVYNYVNDDKRPKFNLKFAAALAAFLVTGIALVGFFMIQRGGAPLAGSDGSPGGAGAGPGAQSRTDYVGLTEAEMALAQLDPTLADQRLQEYREAHPDRVIEKAEPVHSDGVIVGYRITYHER